MKHRRVIKRSELPTTLPTTTLVAAGLLLDRLHAPGWVWGVVGTVLGFVCLGSLFTMFREEEVSVIPEVDPRVAQRDRTAQRLGTL